MSDKTTNIIAGIIGAVILGFALYGVGSVVHRLMEATCS